MTWTWDDRVAVTSDHLLRKIDAAIGSAERACKQYRQNLVRRHAAIRRSSMRMNMLRQMASSCSSMTPVPGLFAELGFADASQNRATGFFAQDRQRGLAKGSSTSHSRWRRLATGGLLVLDVVQGVVRLQNLTFG
jgi:hypothetical protein